MTVRDVCIWVHSLRTWENSESRDKDNRGGEDVNKAIKYLFADGNKKRFIVVAYAHVTKRVANIFCTVFVLDTLDDKIKKCFKLELQAPVLRVNPIMVELLLYAKRLLGIEKKIACVGNAAECICFFFCHEKWNYVRCT